MPLSRHEKDLKDSLQRLRSQIEADFARIEQNGGRISPAKREQLRRLLQRYDELEADRRRARSDRVRDQGHLY